MGTKSQPIITSRDGKTQFSQGVGEAHTVVDTSGNLVIRIGKRPDGTYGGDFAKAGKSITSGLSSDLAFSTAFDSFKIVSTITITLTKSANSDSSSLATVAHGLADVPAMMAFSTYGGTLYQSLPVATPEIATSGAGLNVLTIYAQVDATNVYAQILAPNTGTVHSFYPSAMSATVKCYLLQETAN